MQQGKAMDPNRADLIRILATMPDLDFEVVARVVSRAGITKLATAAKAYLTRDNAPANDLAGANVQHAKPAARKGGKRR
jgi:hypothetical protein